MIPKKRRMDRSEAEALAIAALAFLAEEPERLGRFLALTGLGPEELRSGLERAEVQSAVLAHLRSDESLLLVFAATANIAPERLVEAEQMLGGTTSM